MSNLRKWSPLRGVYLSLDLLREVIDGQASSILSHVRDVRAALHEAMRPKVHPSFVSLLVIGDRGDEPGMFCTMGAAKDIASQDVIELQAMRPIVDATVIAFADLSRVDVQLFRGTDLLGGTIGSCAIAYCDRIEVGVKVFAMCRRRETA